MRAWIVAVTKVIARLWTDLTKQMLTVAKGERAPEEWLTDPHLLAIGLRQIEQHLQHLRNEGFRTVQIGQAAKQFFKAYESADVKNLGTCWSIKPNTSRAGVDSRVLSAVRYNWFHPVATTQGSGCLSLAGSAALSRSCGSLRTLK